MRSTPALAAASNTRREPFTLISRVRSPSPITVNARCTTASAPLTTSRTLASSPTSPSRYSVLRQPCSPGSNGRRAMPTIRFTARERSRASTTDRPRSPVGPVTATVMPVLATGGFYPMAGRGVKGQRSVALARSRAAGRSCPRSRCRVRGRTPRGRACRRARSHDRRPPPVAMPSGPLPPLTTSSLDPVRMRSRPRPARTRDRRRRRPRSRRCPSRRSACRRPRSR